MPLPGAQLQRDPGHLAGNARDPNGFVSVVIESFNEAGNSFTLS